MKIFAKIASIPVIVVMLISGCGQNGLSEGSLEESSTSEMVAHSSDTTECSSEETKLENNIIVVEWDQVENGERIEKFLSNFENLQNDSIEIHSSTIEGDPIYYFVSFDGNKIRLSIDNSEDSYAGSKNGAEEKVFDKIVYDSNGYTLKNETDDDEFILVPS